MVMSTPKCLQKIAVDSSAATSILYDRVEGTEDRISQQRASRLNLFDYMKDIVGSVYQSCSDNAEYSTHSNKSIKHALTMKNKHRDDVMM